MMHSSTTVQGALQTWHIGLTSYALVPASWLSRRRFLRSLIGSALASMPPFVRAAGRLASPQTPGSTNAVDKLKVQFSRGHQAKTSRSFALKFIPTDGVMIDRSTWQGNAGAGRVETQAVVVSYPRASVRMLQNLQTIWAYLISHSNRDTVRRLTQDPAWRIDSRKLRVE